MISNSNSNSNSHAKTNTNPSSGFQVQDHIEEWTEQIEEIKQLPKRGKHVKRFEGILKHREVQVQAKQEIKKKIKISIKENVNNHLDQKSKQKGKACIKKVEDSIGKRSQSSFPNLKSIKFSESIKDVFTYAVEDKMSVNIKTKRLKHILQNSQANKGNDRQAYIQRKRQEQRTHEQKQKLEDRCLVM